MAVQPWALSCHHLTTSHIPQNLVGDGGLSSLINSLMTLITDGALGRTVISYTNTSSGEGQALGIISKSLPATDRVVLGFRFYRNTLDVTVLGSFLRFVNMNGELLNVLAVNGSTTMQVRRGTTVLASMEKPAATTWGFLEIAIYFHSTDGRIITRLNGTEVANVDSLNTMNVAGGLTNILFDRSSSVAGAQNNRYTDFYIKDWPNLEENPFWGPISPLWQPLTSDEDIQGWVASDAGTIYEALQNDNAEYAEPTDSGDTAELGMAPPPGGTTFILARVAVAVSTAPAGGSGIIGLDFKDGANVTENAPNGRIITDQALLSTQTAFHVAGPGNVPWTPESVADANLLLTAVTS